LMECRLRLLLLEISMERVSWRCWEIL